MNLLTRLEKKTALWFLLFLSFAFFLLRLPSLFEPYWYGDEGVYEVIGFALRHGRLLYRDIWDNKPPLLYILYGVCNGDQFSVRLFSLITGIIGVILFFYVARMLFPKGKSSFFSTIIFTIMFGLPIIEGNIANAENFMLPLILSAAILVLWVNKPHNRHPSKNSRLYVFLSHYSSIIILFSAGLLLGIAFLFKIVAIFDLAAFTLFILFTGYKTFREILKQIVTILPLYAGFILPFVLTLLYFGLHHDINDYIKSAFLSNVGYVNYANQFIIPQGLLIGKLLILFIICVFLFIKRKTITTTHLFIYLWLAFSVFNALFSGRPYVHYLLVLLCSFSLFLSMSLYEKRGKIVFTSTLLLILIFLFKDFSYYQKSLMYYDNFIQFITNQKSLTEYRAFFDTATLRDYELAEYINSHMTNTDTVFVWGDNGQLYRLTNTIPPGRYIVAYHATASKQTMEETKQALQQTQPKFVIIMPQKPLLPYSLDSYTPIIDIHGAVIYERIN